MRPSDYQSIKRLIHSLGQNTGNPLSWGHTLTDTPRDGLTSLLGGSQFNQADEIGHQRPLPVHSDVYSCLSETWILVTSLQGTPPSTLKVENLRCGGTMGHRSKILYGLCCGGLGCMGTARDHNRKRALTIKKQLLRINIWGWAKGFMSLDF